MRAAAGQVCCGAWCALGDGCAGENSAGGSGLDLPRAPYQDWALSHGELREHSAAGRDGERVTRCCPPPLARSGAAG